MLQSDPFDVIGGASMLTFRNVDRGWGWRLLALALVAISVQFAIWIVPAPRTPAGENDIAFPTVCKGKFNMQEVSQAQFDLLYADHLQFLARVGGITPTPKDKKADPYAPLKVQALDKRPMSPGFADPLPPSLTGPVHSVDEAGRLDLCGARLIGLNLAGKDLRYGRFMGARLEHTSLVGSKMDDSWWIYSGWASVDASGVSLIRAHIDRLIVTGTSSLKGANVYGASARYAIFESSDLTATSFDSANLEGAKFEGDANITDVDLSAANVAGLIYEPKLGHAPSIPTLRTSKGLDSLQTINASGAAMKELQKSLWDAGMWVESSSVRQALAESSWAEAYPLQQKGKHLLFGVTFAYGRKPWRLVVIVGLLIPLFSILYIIALRSKRDEVGIWIRRDPVDRKDSRKIPPVKLTPKNAHILGMAFLFSLRMGFRIGWKDYNVGDWLARVQRNSYTLDAKGWPRSVAGIQSLVTLYLLALGVLTYLG